MIDLTYKKIIRLAFWVAGTVFIIYLLYKLTEVLIILALSVLLAFIFAPLISTLEGRGLNRLTSTLLTFAVFAFVIYLGLSVIIPKLVYQMNQLVASMQGFSFDEEIKTLEATIIHYFPFIQMGALTTRIESFFSSQLVNIVDSFTQVLSSIISVFTVLIIVPFLAFFLLKDYRRILQGVLKAVPNKFFEMSYHVLKQVSLQLGLFVRAWIFDATFVGVMMGVGFYIIGVPNALPLGVIAGLGHLIPYLGPIIGGVPAAIVAIVQYGDLSQIPLIILVILITYTFDNGFVQPYVFGKGVDMHPIIIILLIISGGILYGLLGMLLVVPIATVIKTLTKEIYFAKKNYKIARV